MALAQENFDRSRDSGRETLRMLSSGTVVDLSKQPVSRLEAWAWELDLVQQSLRLEIEHRQRRTDFGT